MWIYREPLDVTQILAWADAHYARTGQYPDVTSGRVVDAPGEKWVNIDGNLRRGDRELPRGSSLAQLLDELRGKRNIQDLPEFSIEQILAWADAHYSRTGEWPMHDSGPASELSAETWSAIDMALRAGNRGLHGGTSLARLLRDHRGVVRKRRRSRRRSGRSAWASRSLSDAMRKEIESRRAGRNHLNLPPFTIEQILAWADAHVARHGDWPSQHDGLIPGTRGETWCAVEIALSHGLRGLPGDSSLALVLARHRGVRTPRALHDLTIKQVLAWADAHRKRTGEWPTHLSGNVADADGETWSAINHALRRGRRGLPLGSSLTRLLDEHRPAQRPPPPGPLNVSKILRWADAWHRRHGKWPFQSSGPIPESPSDNWRMVDAALRCGHRGLDGGSSLAQLLAEHRGKRKRTAPPPLSEEQILAWADAYYERHGIWPTQASGPVTEVSGETWSALNQSLVVGRRGLAGGSTLAKLLDRYRRKVPQPVTLAAAVEAGPSQIAVAPNGDGAQTRVSRSQRASAAAQARPVRMRPK